jgi:hypothetical protein
MASASDSEQDWINKYRAAIPEPAEKPTFNKMLGRIGYLMGSAIGETQKLLKRAAEFAGVSRPERPRPGPHGEIGIESTKNTRSSAKQNRGKSAA